MVSQQEPIEFFFFFFDVDNFKSLLNLFEYCFCFTFWLFSHWACGLLAPWPRIEPTPSASEGEMLTTGSPGKSLETWRISLCNSRTRTNIPRRRCLSSRITSMRICGSVTQRPFISTSFKCKSHFRRDKNSAP